jgi:hypothetical protein
MRSYPALEKLRRHTGVAGFVLLGVLCRALIPVGFMPAAIGAGGPVAVCHGGLAGEFFRQLSAQTGAVAVDDTEAAHAGHALHDTVEHGAHASAVNPAAAPDHGGHTGDGDASDSAHEAWEHCPVGTAFGAIAIGAEFEFSLPVLRDTLEAVEPAELLSQPFVSSYRARAPPAIPHLS